VNAETAKICLVTGGSSGIGKAVCRCLQEQGCTVYEFSRRQSGAPEGVRHFSVDVTDESAVNAAVERILAEAGHIDVLVNNAGFGISGAVEFTPMEEARRQMDVNFFGMVTVTKAVVGHMRERGSGRIVNVSSVAAPAAIPFQSFYSCSKAAINDYTLALANEVRPYGVTVCAVEPGDICTGFTDARRKNPEGDDVYGGRIARSVAGMEKDERGGMAPEKAGRMIASVAMKKNSKPIMALGFSYKVLCVLIKLLPVRLVNWLVGLLYAR